MKKITLTLVAAVLLSCNEPNHQQADFAKNNEIFDTHVETFKNHFLKGFEEENVELMLSMYADSISWDGPNEGGVTFSKEDLSEVFINYIENFDDIKLNDQLYFGGSVYANPMEPFSDPDYIRVVGTWTNVHAATGIPTTLKWHAVMWFNEDGKVYRGSDWMDVASLEGQISRQLEMNE